MAASTSGTEPPPPHEYSLQEVGQMLFDMNIRFANQDKKIMSNKFEQESFARQQALINKNLEETLARLVAAGPRPADKPPDTLDRTPTARGWKLPPSLTTKPLGFDADAQPRLKLEPPRFNGDNASDWIRKIQKYFNHNFTPLADRMYLTSFLFDHPVSDWMGYWEDNNTGIGWDEFLMAVEQLFDPDLYEDYVGRLATLRQTSSVKAYQTTFESMLQKVSHVADSTLTSLFIAGLKPQMKQELLTKRPGTLQEAFVLAQQVAACHAALAMYGPFQRSGWSGRESRQNAGATPSPTPASANNRDSPSYRDLPVVKISAAERAEKTKKGLCWYCDETWSRSHVCSKKFLALMGTEEDDECEGDHEGSLSDDEGENMCIQGDV